MVNLPAVDRALVLLEKGGYLSIGRAETAELRGLVCKLRFVIGGATAFCYASLCTQPSDHCKVSPIPARLLFDTPVEQLCGDFGEAYDSAHTEHINEEKLPPPHVTVGGKPILFSKSFNALP